MAVSPEEKPKLRLGMVRHRIQAGAIPIDGVICILCVWALRRYKRLAGQKSCLLATNKDK